MQAVTVGQLLPTWQKLISLALLPVIELRPMLTRYYKDTNTVEEAIELLRDNRLGSVPVHDAAGKWLGYVGAIDLLAGIVKTIKDGKLPTATDTEEEVFKAFFTEAHFRLKPLKDANRNPFITLPANAPLTEAVGLIEKGIQRLAITEGLKMVGILSQIDVVRFLDADATKTLGENAQKTLAELNFLKPVKVIKVTAPMLTAIVAMEREGLRSLAVVDNHWHIVAQLSPSDIMSVLPSVKFTDLNRPLLEYLPRLHDLVWKNKPMVCLHETDTLATGLRELILHGVHQLWIVNLHKVPVGVATLTDVLQVFMRHLDAVAFTKALTPKEAQLVSKQAEAKRNHDQQQQRRAEWSHGSVSRKHMTDAHTPQPDLYLGAPDAKPDSVIELL